MAKIMMQDLASALVEHMKLSVKDASLFVSEMFDIVQTHLEEDKIVKIKGLGTFKIIDVDDRESVNVNTGERVLIEGHGKITFTPDPLMKELVNKPFSQFETVVLNDGVNFEDVPSGENEVPEPVEELIEKTIEEPAEDVEKDDSSMMPLVDFGEEPAPKVASKPEQVSAPVAQPEIEDEDIPEWVIEPYVPAPKDEVPVEVEKVEAPAEEQVLAEDSEEPEEEETPAEESESEEEEVYETSESGGKKWLAVLLACLLGLAVGYVLGNYFPYSTFIQKSDVTPVVEPAIEPVATPDTTALADSVNVEANVEAQSEAQSEEKPEAKPAPEADIHDLYAEKDVRVRMGGYRIVGTDKVIRAKEGETLSKIARHYFGPDMECYIEVYNNLSKSSELKVGQEIKIPKLESKKKKKVAQKSN